MIEQFLTDKQVGERYNVTSMSVRNWMRDDPQFPRPLKLSPGSVRWRLSDLERWEQAKAEETQAPVRGSAATTRATRRTGSEAGA